VSRVGKEEAFTVKSARWQQPQRSRKTVETFETVLVIETHFSFEVNVLSTKIHFWSSSTFHLTIITISITPILEMKVQSLYLATAFSTKKYRIIDGYYHFNSHSNYWFLWITTFISNSPWDHRRHSTGKLPFYPCLKICSRTNPFRFKRHPSRLYARKKTHIMTDLHLGYLKPHCDDGLTQVDFAESSNNFKHLILNYHPVRLDRLLTETPYCYWFRALWFTSCVRYCTNGL